MKGNLSLATIVCLLLFAACADPITAPSPVDDLDPAFAIGLDKFKPGEQQNVADDTRGFTYAIYPVGEGQILAQTFTPTKNKRLGYLELPIGCSADVLLNVKIREGLGGPILYESNHAGLPVVVDGSFQLLQVYDPATSHGIRLRKHRTYAFELAAFPANPNVFPATCGIMPGPPGDAYAGGQVYYQDPINGPDFLAIQPEEDLPFITLVR